MYIPKKDREIIKMKFGGLCAYTGTQLEDYWQVDHINPKRLYDAGRINGDSNRKGGTLIDFEKIELNCQLYES